MEKLNQWAKKYGIVLVILFIGAFLRFYKLGEVPAVLNIDEASIGYNAYSLLHTGREEHGQAWPINVKSFGDWKLPVYIYITVVNVAIFGLNAWSVRLASALAGVVIILVTYLLVCQLLKNYEATGIAKDKRETWAKITATLIAILPWAIQLSRMAYEANLALCFFLLGFWLWEKYKQALLDGKWQPRLGFWLGTLCFGLTLFTYHSYQLIIPLFGIVWLIFNWRLFTKIWLKNKIVVFGAAILMLFVVVVLLMSNTMGASNTKMSGVSIFDAKRYAHQTFISRQTLAAEDMPSSLQSFYANRYVFIGRQFLSNLLQTLDFNYYFVISDENVVADIDRNGNFHFFEIIFFLVGLIAIIRKPNRFYKLLLCWWLIAVLPGIITVQPLHFARSAAVMLPMLLIITQGIWQIVCWRNWTKIIIILIYLYGIFYWWFSYFYIASLLDAKHNDWPMKEMALELKEIKSDYEQIYMPSHRQHPYIHLLFYWQYPAQNLVHNINYLPDDWEGLSYVNKLENIDFGDINWDENELIFGKTPNALNVAEEIEALCLSESKLLYIIEPHQLPVEQEKSGYYVIIKKQTMPEIHRELWWIEYDGCLKVDTDLTS